MKKVIVCNSLGQLSTGRKLILFPSRWTAAVNSPSKPFCFYPYELAYLSSLLKRELDGNEYEVKMLDPNMLGLDKEDTIKLLELHKPDYAIFEPSALDSREILEIAAHLKNKFNTVTIIGGAYAQAEPEICTKYADYAVPGEYETYVLDIIKSGLGNNGRTSAIYPSGKKNLIDPDYLPFPEDDDICRLDYTEPGCDFRMIQIYASRGCPLACTFCVSPTYYGCKPNTWRSRDPENVADEIEFLANKYKGSFEGFFINEESHNSDKVWVAKLCETLIRRGLNNLKYDAMCLYHNFDDDLFALMRRAGYYQLRFGIESLDEGVGKSIHKRIKYDSLKKMLEKMKAFGFVTYGTSIVGGQDSSFESDLNTHNMLCTLRDDLKLLDKWQISIATPQPGTEFYKWAKKNGYIITDDLSRYNGRQAVVNYPGYPAEAIELMYDIYTGRKKVSPEEAMEMLKSREAVI